MERTEMTMHADCDAIFAAQCSLLKRDKKAGPPGLCQVSKQAAKWPEKTHPLTVPERF